MNNGKCIKKSIWESLLESLTKTSYLLSVVKKISPGDEWTWWNCTEDHSRLNIGPLNNTWLILKSWYHFHNRQHNPNKLSYNLFNEKCCISVNLTFDSATKKKRGRNEGCSFAVGRILINCQCHFQSAPPGGRQAESDWDSIEGRTTILNLLKK